MTEQERATDSARKRIESAESHVAMFREMEAVERARLTAGGPYPVDEAVSFRQADYYAGRVREHEAALRAAEADLAALRRPPLA